MLGKVGAGRLVEVMTVAYRRGTTHPHQEDSCGVRGEKLV